MRVFIILDPLKNFHSLSNVLRCLKVAFQRPIGVGKRPAYDGTRDEDEQLFDIHIPSERGGLATRYRGRPSASG